MKKLLLIFALLFGVLLSAQVKIGDNPTTIGTSSVLELESATKALLISRVPNTASITAPVNGMLIYDLSSGCVKGYQNGAWTDCIGSNSLINAILVQIGNEGDSPNLVPSLVSTTQLNQLPITGVVVGNQAAYQAYIDANPNLFSAPATVAEVQAMITTVNNSVVPTITSTTGRIWMDRNLGATRVATSSTDHLAYGDLYQWGRNADGHEKITWTSSTTGTPVNGTTATRPNADQATTPLFIITINSGNIDWRGTTQNNNLWQGVAGINNPCQAGFRVPTSAEIDAEVAAYGITNSVTAFSSPFKFPVPGYRNNSTGALSAVGSVGYYWSSSVSGASASNRYFFSGGTGVFNDARALGFTVRCIKD